MQMKITPGSKVRLATQELIALDVERDFLIVTDRSGSWMYTKKENVELLERRLMEYPPRSMEILHSCGELVFYNNIVVIHQTQKWELLDTTASIQGEGPIHECERTLLSESECLALSHLRYARDRAVAPRVLKKLVKYWVEVG